MTTTSLPTPIHEAPAQITPTYWVRGVPAALVETFWHYAVPYIKRALDHANGEFDPADFRSFCQSRDMQLWIVARQGRVVGAATTEVIIYPRKKTLRVVTLAGSEFEHWVHLADEAFEQFARGLGCAGVECYVRRGFVKKLEPIGYKLRHCMLLKELT